MARTHEKQNSTARSRRDLLTELRETHQRFVQSLLAKRLYISSVSTTAKTPFKAFWLREAMYYRMTDLSGAAIDLYEQNRIVPAIIIIRAAYETAALCFYVYEKLNEAIKNHDFIAMDKFLMKAGFGGKLDEARCEAFNILTAIGHLDKQFDGLKRMYHVLCEFAHPNWMGCKGAYSTLNTEEHYCEFSLNRKGTELGIVGLSELSAALAVFEHYYNETGSILPQVVRLCEECIDRRMAKFASLASSCSQEQNSALYFDMGQSRTWAICFEGPNTIVAACAIDESDTPQLTTKDNEYLRTLLNEKDKLVFVTDNTAGGSVKR